MVRSDESAFEGEEIVSSELRWYGNARRAGVCSPVACWRRVIAATVGLGGRA